MKSKKKIKQRELDSAELAIEQELANGEWTEQTSLEHAIIEAAQEKVAKRNRDARINIRMTEETLQMIQDLAKQEGVGYQTLISSVVHKYAHGRLVNTTDLGRIISSIELKKASSE